MYQKLLKSKINYCFKDKLSIYFTVKDRKTFLLGFLITIIKFIFFKKL